MGIFNYEEFDYDTVVKTNKGRHEKFKKYKDMYVNKENKKTYIEVFYNCFGKIKEIFSYIDGKKNDLNGMAAVLKFNSEGEIYYEAHYLNGLFHNTNGPAIKICSEYFPNIILEQHYMKNGKYHKFDGPAVIIRDLGSNSTTSKYYINGKIHRIGDLPAIITVNESGNITSEVFYKRGRQHRDGDLPAVIKRFKNGVLQKEVYLKNGKKHRDNGKPALITYRKNGAVKRECYFVDGKIDETKEAYATEYFSKHTIKKQSFSLGNGYTYTIKFGADGNKRKIVCLKNGKKHNAFGPAEVEYNSTGEITEEYFYLDGVMVDDMTFMIRSGSECVSKEQDVFNEIIYKEES